MELHEAANICVLGHPGSKLMVWQRYNEEGDETRAESETARIRKKRDMLHTFLGNTRLLYERDTLMGCSCLVVLRFRAPCE